MKTETEVKHTPTPWTLNEKEKHPFIIEAPSNIPGIPATIVKVGYRPNAAFIVRAVNCHEELLRKLNDARKIIAELTQESKEHKKPSGRYCDECSPSQVWPCSIVRGYYEGKALEEVIAKAEGK